MLKRVMRLQLFGESEQLPTEPEQTEENGQNAGGNSFDDFLKDPANQSEFDRRISKALEKQKASLSVANQKALEEAKKEAEKLARMNADQKKDYELEQLKAENERLKAGAMKAELGRTASQLLKDQNIDATQDILDFVVGADAEETKKNIENFSAIVQAQLKAAEVAKATGTVPKNFGGGEPVSEIQKRIAKYRH